MHEGEIDFLSNTSPIRAVVKSWYFCAKFQEIRNSSEFCSIRRHLPLKERVSVGGYMRNLLAWVGTTLLQAGACVGVGSMGAYVLGYPGVISSLTTGVAIVAVYWIYYGYRFFFASGSRDGRLKSALQTSTYVRWVVLIASLVWAGGRSPEDFFALAVGLLLTGTLMLLNLILYAYHPHANREK